jgi:DNA-nicking Smr family endonuclease
MNRRKPRGLRNDEKELWKQVAATAVPMRHDKVRAIVVARAAELPQMVLASEPDLLRSFEVGAGIASKPSARVNYAPPPVGDTHLNMDRKAFTRLKRGKLSPEGRIDLHGMTLARAHVALNNFILSAHGDGKRLVLVITGKGKDRDEGGPIPTKRGILRHQVPDWLRMMPLAPMVMQITQAHLKHGGGGAYYVYLRRVR